MNATELDLGPLIWVKGEIDQALARAVEALQQCRERPGDSAQMRFAQSHVHQAHGALAIVGLEGVTRVSEALEALLGELEQGAVPATTESCELCTQAIATLRHYLDELVNGGSNQPLKLLPIYEQLQRSRGAPPVIASELFYPDLSLRPPKRETAGALPPDQVALRTKAARGRFQRGFLQWLRCSDGVAGLTDMRQAVGAIEALQNTAADRAFWWITLGFLDVLENRAITADVAVKRLCARIDHQMRRLLSGTPGVAERLLRDLLYYVAIALTGGEQARQVKLAYRLDGLVPDARRPDPGPLQPLLRAVREALQQAKDTWNKFCAGAAVALPQFDEQAGQLAARARALSQPDLAALLDAVAETAQWLRKDPLRHGEGMAMELATALLLAENCIDAFEHPDPDFPRQARLVAGRLAMLRAGEMPPPLDAPLLGEMSRRAQEKLFLSQVAREILTTLAQVEQTLDGYFRDASRRPELAALDKPFRQVEGALTMLGHEQAVAVLRECAAKTAAFAHAESVPPQAEFEDVAHKLSGLGFFVEALQHGPADLEAILYPERARERQAAVASVEAALDAQRAEAQRLLEQFRGSPHDEELRRELQRRFETIRQEANLVADTGLEQQAAEALAALAAPPPAKAVEPAQPVADIAPAAPAAPPPSAPVPVDEDKVDAELLSIFIEEAQEVLQTIAANLKASRGEPHNHDTLTTIRRGFHTLKGSGRMVGLKELGECAWAAEQVMNLWLRLERDATSALHAFIDNAHALLHAWVQQLVAGGSTHMDARAVLGQADAMLATESGEQPAAAPTQAPEPAPAAAAEPAAPAAPSAEAPTPCADEPVRIGELAISHTLYELFLGEARQHLATLRHDLARLHLKPGTGPEEQTVRAAHTLAGIAGTVGIRAVHDLGRALEQALGRLARLQQAPTSDQSEVLGNAASVLEGMVKAIEHARPPQPLPDLFDWLNAIAPGASAHMEEILSLEDELEIVPLAEEADEPEAELAPSARVHALAPPTRVEPPEVPERRRARLPDDVDRQLLPLFLEEANDLMREIGEETRGWREAPQDGDRARALARLLHTLKGSARMAGAMGLGELVHQMENRIEEALAQGAPAAQFFEELDGSLDRAAMLIEQLREPAAPPVAAEAAAPRVEGVRAPVTQEEDEAAAARALLRVRADLVDQFVNEAGEISIARARIEGEMRTVRTTLLDLTENVIRLRNQLRELEIQAESQMQSRMAQAEAQQAEFDPLEMDRFTRLQELSRMMAESVNDLSTVQQNVLRNLDGADSALSVQGRLTRDLQQSLMNVRMVAFASIADRLHRIVRQTAKELNCKATLDIRGGQVELDRSVLEKITGPLEHLLRNSIGHGLETREARLAAGKPEIGQIGIALSQEGNEIAIDFSDDGRGLDFERIRTRAVEAGLLAAGAQPDESELVDLVFRSGFTTAETLSEVSGRGVGMDVVRNTVQGLGGRIEVSSVAGRGVRFRILLPQSLVVMQALLVRGGGRTYAIPSSMISQVMELKADGMARLRASGAAEWLGQKYPLRYLARLLGDAHSQPPAARYSCVVLAHAGAQRVAVQVDELRGNHEIVIKKTGAQLARVIGVAGATVLADGEIALILNPGVLLGRSARQAVEAPDRQAPVEAAAEDRRAMVMVVDDSLTVRKITGRLLEREGYRVVTAKDGVDALEQLLDTVPDVMLVDIEMPRMDGFDLTRNVRADTRLARVPIIMITSRLADKHRSYAKEIGVDHYLGKPYQEDELLRLIRSYIRDAVAA